MEDNNIEDKIRELVREFGTATVDPKNGKLTVLARQSQDNNQKPEKSTSSVQESLDYLRICIKYQIFDLEATRRENEYLRKVLGELST